MGSGLCLDKQSVEQVNSMQIQLPASPASLVDVLAESFLTKEDLFGSGITVLVPAYSLASCVSQLYDAQTITEGEKAIQSSVKRFGGRSDIHKNWDGVCRILSLI